MSIVRLLCWACACVVVAFDLVGSAARAADPVPGADATPRLTRYGAPVVPGEPVALSAVLGRPERYAGRTVTVQGKVRRACSRKGCWMEIAESLAPAAPGCRVTFKDYAFFIPTDIVGTEARVQGRVETATVTAAHVEHLESEGASFARKNPDGTATEVRVVATGVELTSR